MKKIKPLPNSLPQAYAHALTHTYTHKLNFKKDCKHNAYKFDLLFYIKKNANKKSNL